VTETIVDTSVEAPRWLTLVRSGVAVAAFAGIAWSMSRMPGPRAPDPVSCSAAGSPFNVRGLDAPIAGPKLFLHAAFLGHLSSSTDFCVFRDGRWIGRIRIAQGTPLNPDRRWAINLPLPIPPWGHGPATSLPEAQQAFAAAWERFYAGLTPDDIAHWHQLQDAAASRR
jgi:hypothetical protein